MKLIPKILISIAGCFVIGFFSSFATQSSIDTWFASLIKPSFNPPNWIFGPVWTLLYILMGVAAGIVWSKGYHHRWVKTALYHFVFQLLFNGLWSIVFFGFQCPGLALIVILVLLVLIILTYKWFKIASRIAAYLLIPYLAWVLFAAVLNFSIWQLN